MILLFGAKVNYFFVDNSCIFYLNISLWRLLLSECLLCGITHAFRHIFVSAILIFILNDNKEDMTELKN